MGGSSIVVIELVRIWTRPIPNVTTMLEEDYYQRAQPTEDYKDTVGWEPQVGLGTAIDLS